MTATAQMSELGGISDQERLDRLRLCRSERVGPITFLNLMKRAGNASAALEALPALARRGGLKRGIKICPRDQAEQEIEQLAAIGGRMVTLGEAAYPRPLAAIADPPPVLSVLGRGAVLDDDAVAIVGARNASASGGRFARGLASDLGAGGLTVVSGMARGIDTEAHIGSVESGTVAVLAGGVDNIYPPENQDLYARIAQAGVVVSEQPFGLAPQGRHFPRRNRIISGLSLGVVVVEASLRSGSLITARLAGEQGRDVFAVPGSPLDPRHRGTNGLIRDGATLIENADDVREALGAPRRTQMRDPEITSFEAQRPRESQRLEATAKQRDTVLSVLGPTPVGVDELVRQCHLTPAEVMVVILELELAGRLARHAGGMISIT